MAAVERSFYSQDSVFRYWYTKDLNLHDVIARQHLKVERQPPDDSAIWISLSERRLPNGDSYRHLE